MSLSVVEQVQSAAVSLATTIGGAQGLTLAVTPAPGDLLVVAAKSNNSVAAVRTVVSVSGVGATWSSALAGDRISFWVGTGATTVGDVTVTMSGAGDCQATVYNIRGLISPVSAGGVFTGQALGTTRTGIAQTVSPNQVVIAAAVTGGAGPPSILLTYPSSQTPAGWTTASITSSSLGQAGDAYRIPQVAASHQTSATGASNSWMEVASCVLGHPDPEPAPFSITATDVFPVVEMAPFTITASSLEPTLVGVSPWIPTLQRTQPAVVWLPDAGATDVPSEGGWGLVVAVNH